jgi:hypothetical protein
VKSIPQVRCPHCGSERNETEPRCLNQACRARHPDFGPDPAPMGEGAEAVRRWMDHPEVGDVFIFARECMGNPPGTRAVCYEVYRLGTRPGFSFIFANGAYDGFSPGDLDLFGGTFVEPDALEHGYTFTNVGVLAQDYHRGVFDRALHLNRGIRS